MAEDEDTNFNIDTIGQQIPDGEMLEIALGELDRAHQEIARLIGVSKQNDEAVSRHVRDLRDGGVQNDSAIVEPKTIRLTSRFHGNNALTFPIKDKSYDQGYVWARALQHRLGQDAGFLRAFRDLQGKRGEITASLLLIHELARVQGKADRDGVRRLEGRIRELSGWVPRIPGPLTPVNTPVPNRVIHLVKESRPFLSNGFTSRSHHNFVAEAAAGLEPIIVTEPGFPRSTGLESFAKKERVDEVLHIRLDLPSQNYSEMPVDEFLQVYAQMAYEEVMRYRPSVIHASSGRRGYDTALVAMALKEKTGIPFVYEVRSFFEANWTADLERESKGEIYARRKFVEMMCMNAADRILTISSSMKDELVARGVPSGKIGIIPNAVDTNVFKPQARSEQLEAEFGLQGLPTFGYVSNMDHYRESQETLIEACAVLKNRGSEFRCVLVGDGPRRNLLEEHAARLGVEDRVVFTGSVDHTEIPDYYSLIDFFVVPRVAERASVYVTPLKPFEAMASAKPVITSDLPALQEIVDAPNRGVTFASGDAASLADVLLSYAADPVRVATTVDAALEWVTSHRRWELNGQRYVSEFSKAAGVVGQ